MIKPVVLCILDGWGHGKQDKFNAIFNAQPKYYNSLLENYPNSLLITSGVEVGLPEGQMGNSETGHMTIGSGRVIMQELERINASIISKELHKNVYIKNIISDLQNTNKCCHLIGLLSDGGVHSHINHIIEIARFLTYNAVQVKIHVITDGRDTLPKTALEFLQKTPCEVATISGRFYAMDRDERAERTELASQAIIQANGLKFESTESVIQDAYKTDITDEFILPNVSTRYSGMQNGDAVLFCNFRADRMRQITAKIIDSGIDFSSINTLTSYSDKIDKCVNVLYPPEKIKNTLSEVLEQNGIAQLRIAETEKYAHVTFFFSSGKEEQEKGEARILVQSPKARTYDLAPEMSAREITEKLVAELHKDTYGFILVNFANADMVGHTGNYDATIEAIQTIDACLEKIGKEILKKNGTLIVTADHGNAESMFDIQNNSYHTAHTINPVPFIIVNDQLQHRAKLLDGSLADAAPTILNLLKISIPKEMTGKVLLQNVYQNQTA